MKFTKFTLMSACALVATTNVSGNKIQVPQLRGALQADANEPPMACPMDVKGCPDGRYLNRDPMNDCEFPKCSDDSRVVGRSSGKSGKSGTRSGSRSAKSGKSSSSDYKDEFARVEAAKSSKSSSSSSSSRSSGSKSSKSSSSDYKDEFARVEAAKSSKSSSSDYKDEFARKEDAKSKKSSSSSRKDAKSSKASNSSARSSPHDPSDCILLGETAASMIAREYCGSASGYSSGKYDKECRSVAINQCKGSVYGKISSTSGCPIPDTSTLRGLQNTCSSQVDWLLGIGEVSAIE